MLFNKPKTQIFFKDVLFFKDLKNESGREIPGWLMPVFQNIELMIVFLPQTEKTKNRFTNYRQTLEGTNFHPRPQIFFWERTRHSLSGLWFFLSEMKYRFFFLWIYELKLSVDSTRLLLRASHNTCDASADIGHKSFYEEDQLKERRFNLENTILTHVKSFQRSVFFQSLKNGLCSFRAKIMCQSLWFF